jgi:hypothetical protein
MSDPPRPNLFTHYGTFWLAVLLFFLLWGVGALIWGLLS